MSLFCYSVLTRCKVRLKENKIKCQSHRSKNVNSCQQMFNAVKRDEKKKSSFLLISPVNCTI